MNVVMFSRKFFVRNSGSSCRNTWCTFCSNVSVFAARIIRLMARMVSGVFVVILVVSFCAVLVSLVVGITWFIRLSLRVLLVSRVCLVNMIFVAWV